MTELRGNFGQYSFVVTSENGVSSIQRTNSATGYVETFSLSNSGQVSLDVTGTHYPVADVGAQPQIRGSTFTDVITHLADENTLSEKELGNLNVLIDSRFRNRDAIQNIVG